MKKIGLIALAIALLVGGLIAVPGLIGPKASSVQAAPAPNIPTAEANGLTWLAAHQQTTGDTEGAWYYFDDDSQAPPASSLASSDGEDLGTTAIAVFKLEERAKELGQDPLNPADATIFPYASKVAAGLNYLFGSDQLVNDTTGVYFNNFYNVFDTSMAMMALAASNNPTSVVSGTGPCGGLTYKTVLQDMTNWLVSAQITTGDNTGGWAQHPDLNPNDAEQTDTGYAALALGFAHAPEYGFNITIPTAVITNLGAWTTAVQVTSSDDDGVVAEDGGSWDGPDNANSLGANIDRTGSLIYELGLIGKTSTSAQVTAAVGFIESVWGNSVSTADLGGWQGDYEAMFDLMEGLRSLGIAQLTVSGSPLAWLDAMTTYVINNQKSDGSWLSTSITNNSPVVNPVLNTTWALLTLEEVVPQVPIYALTMAAAPAKGGTATDKTNDSPYLPGTVVTISATPATGYQFVNWTALTGSFGETTKADTTFTMPSQAITVTANFEAIPTTTYTVTYNGNSNTGGTVPADNNNYINGATVTVLGNTGSLVRAGYTFAGWNTAANGSGTAYVGGNTFAMGSANVTLYAQWTAAPTYTVTYNGNSSTGGTVPADNNNYINGATVTVLGNIGNLVRTGYTFAGWNTAANGSGTAYVGGNTFAIGSANVTLYAQWTAAPTYTVPYNGNSNTGGTVPADNNNYIDGATVTVLGNTGNLVRTGYTFAGWNTAADGSGTAYVGGNTFAMGSTNVTLYAQWTAAPAYTVTYNGNSSTGGTVPADNNNYINGATVTVLGNTGSLVRTGYTFAGWNTAANGSGTAYVGGNTFAMGSANVTLYAQWTAAPTYTVPYNGNSNTGGTVPADNNNYIDGATVTVLGNTGNLVRTGYTFAGWNTAADGSGTAYVGGNTFAMGSTNVTLYAQWTAIGTYTVTFDKNGGDTDAVPNSISGIAYNAMVTLPTPPTRSGYTFIGWNTLTNGTGTAFMASTPVTASITVYAQWTAIGTYTVTAKVEPTCAATAGCNITGNTSPYSAGDLVSLTAHPADGWTFSGWTGCYTSSNATLTFTMPTSDVTLIANFTVSKSPCGGGKTTCKEPKPGCPGGKTTGKELPPGWNREHYPGGRMNGREPGGKQTCAGKAIGK